MILSSFKNNKKLIRSW